MELDKILEPGLKVSISSRDGDILEVVVGENTIEARILDMESLVKKISKKSDSKRGLRDLADVAKKLEAKEYTLDVLDEDKLILRLGRDARPGLLKFFGPIQVVDLKSILRLMG